MFFSVIKYKGDGVRERERSCVVTWRHYHCHYVLVCREEDQKAKQWAVPQQNVGIRSERDYSHCGAVWRQRKLKCRHYHCHLWLMCRQEEHRTAQPCPTPQKLWSVFKHSHCIETWRCYQYNADNISITCGCCASRRDRERLSCDLCHRKVVVQGVHAIIT